MDGIAWAASAMGAAQQRLDIATDNLANAQTDGFTRLLAHGSITKNGVRMRAIPWRGYAALRPTKRPFDLALVGPGAFFVQTPAGARIASRDGAFERSASGTLVDRAGNVLLGRHGVVHVGADARIDLHGVVRESTAIVDTIAHTAHSRIRSGWLEASSVDSITEMIDVMSAQRTFEMAEKVAAAIDSTHQKAAQNVATLS